VHDDGKISRLEKCLSVDGGPDPSLRWFRQNGLNWMSRVEDFSEKVAALALQGRLRRAAEDWWPRPTSRT